MRYLPFLLLLASCDPAPASQKTLQPVPKPAPAPAPAPEPICEPCVPERTAHSLEVDPDCPCVWTKALSRALTNYKDDTDRTHNLMRASSLIYGKVLQPGEEFSFNDTVGKRNEKNGFKKAKVVFGGVLIDDWGGGVCQVSSTLHWAVLRAGLRPTQRTPHSRPSSYIGVGLDAAVSWPAVCEDDPDCPRIDFRFVNDYGFPLGLKVWFGNPGQLVAGIYADKDLKLDVQLDSRFVFRGDFGVRERRSKWIKHPTKVQSGQMGRSATTHVKVLYENGEALHDFKFHSLYRPVPEVWDVPLEEK